VFLQLLVFCFSFMRSDPAKIQGPMMGLAGILLIQRYD
jgi:hypothetical protein